MNGDDSWTFPELPPPPLLPIGDGSELFEVKVFFRHEDGRLFMSAHVRAANVADATTYLCDLIRKSFGTKEGDIEDCTTRRMAE